MGGWRQIFINNLNQKKSIANDSTSAVSTSSIYIYINWNTKKIIMN